MFPYKIFKRVLRRTSPKVHDKPIFLCFQRYVTENGTEPGYVTLWEGSVK